MKNIKYFLTALVLIFASFSGCSSEKTEETHPETDVSENTQTSVSEVSETPDAPEEPAEEVPAETETENFVYERVVLLGVDGAGNFFRDTDTPNLDRIFENGAVSYDVLTSEPTISAECWGSMLHGVTPECHRLSNSLVESTPFDPESEFPSVFRVIRENDPDAVLASFCNWNPINVGIIEDGLDVHKDSGGDAAITQKICDYVAENDPKLLFVQFDEVDGAGHGSGYGSAQHLKQITTTDGYIGKIYEAYEKRGFLDTTLFLVTADHGGTPNGSHGGLTDAEKYVMYAAVGKTVEKGTIEDMMIRDNASVILHALGYEQPDTWTGIVPSGLFEGVEAGERPVYTIQYAFEHRIHESVPTPAVGSGNSVVDVLGAERVRTYLTFDDTTADAVGKAETEEKGKLYYVEGYYGNGVQFDDGSVALKDFTVGTDSFSAVLWMKAGSIGSDPSLFSNKDWNSGSNPGFILSLRSGDVKFNAGNGSTRMDKEYPFPIDYKDGWVHLTLVVDREAGEVRFAYDFGDFITVEIPAAMKDSSFDAYKNLCIGQDGTKNYSAALPAVLDEFVLIDGVLSGEDVKALAEIYK